VEGNDLDFAKIIASMYMFYVSRGIGDQQALALVLNYQETVLSYMFSQQNNYTTLEEMEPIGNYQM
jgi:hypothetical protein